MNIDRFCFRVYDKNNEQYIDSDETELFINNDASLLFGSFGEVVLPPEEQSNYIIEQCTGLSDKIGNLIYENDQFYDSNKRLCTVSWHNGAFHNGFGNLLSNLRTEEIEIIGNIHDQKEGA